MRVVSEALGLGVCYVGSGTTGHGSYVIISTNENIDSDLTTVNAEIQKAHALGL